MGSLWARRGFPGLKHTWHIILAHFTFKGVRDLAGHEKKPRVCSDPSCSFLPSLGLSTSFPVTFLFVTFSSHGCGFIKKQIGVEKWLFPAGGDTEHRKIQTQASILSCPEGPSAGWRVDRGLGEEGAARRIPWTHPQQGTLFSRGLVAAGHAAKGTSRGGSHTLPCPEEHAQAWGPQTFPAPTGDERALSPRTLPSATAAIGVTVVALVHHSVSFHPGL